MAGSGSTIPVGAGPPGLAGATLLQAIERHPRPDLPALSATLDASAVKTYTPTSHVKSARPSMRNAAGRSGSTATEASIRLGPPLQVSIRSAGPKLAGWMGRENTTSSAWTGPD